MQTQWLNSFSDINKLAVQKILQKFQKAFFIRIGNENNAFVAQLLEFMLDSKMTCDTALQMLQKDICSFYCKHFTKGNLKVAKRELEGFQQKMNLRDSRIVFFFSGMTLSLVFMLILVIIYPSSFEDIDELKNFFPPFRVTSIFVFAIISTGILLKVFLRFKVNYMFIFELDAVKRI